MCLATYSNSPWASSHEISVIVSSWNRAILGLEGVGQEASSSKSLFVTTGIIFIWQQQSFTRRRALLLLAPLTLYLWCNRAQFCNSPKKISCIPPISHENRFVTNFKEKTESFNSFFAEQCSNIDDSSEIPSFLHPKTDKFLSNITFTEKDIEKVIQSLDSNKAHRHNMMSKRMLKICGKSIIKPLLIIFKKCPEKGCFPNEWKKANVVPVHKK